MTIGISIAHAPHLPGRPAALERLRAQLPAWPVHLEDAPGKPHEWSERQWRGGLALGTDYVLCLNDDVCLCEGFPEVLEACVAARPGHLLSLFPAHPLARQAQIRQMRWITTCDGLIGNAYLLPRASLQDFLEWRATAPVPGFVEYCSEDNLLNLWAMAQGALIWHTVPALVSHDESVPSCFGNAPVACPVPPRKRMPREGWDTDAVHVGRYYSGAHYYLVTRMREPMVARYHELCEEPAQ
jgi:hypothetical protein